MRYTLTVKQRFFKYVGLPNEDGCMLWQASIMPTGYGCLRVNKETKYAHRLSYEIWVGPIPPGLQIDHLCRVRACVNPEHLEAVTQSENIARGDSIPTRNSRKTHCPQGHAYPPGKRRCQKCVRENQRRRYRENEEYREKCRARARARYKALRERMV